MPSVALLVLGTSNRKKAQELRELLRPLALQIKTLADYPHAINVEETGDSFAANAALKAVGQARHLNAWVLGEDSGLVVDALGGAPGIYSARYAGPLATDQQNNEHLLAQLGDMPLPRRTAHYVCQLALSDPRGTVRAESGGRCDGRIRFEAAGTAGFGYDPLFEIVEYHRTFAELGETVKSALSHR
ncbi:MAG: RdgB/HAM1 family non-canonical purine NTP pyrophosphatase, partial [Planctomycetia bacterium]|nr:RdgB/HAM1 family non-canonical purine NTP pyrophosphatase [Planctomycetia bacterium]